ICDFYLDSVRYRHREFCEPTRAYADFVIPGGVHQEEARDACLAQACEQIRDLVTATRRVAGE
ncbi:MAG: hypothetical protein JXA57_10440, partial [Armatimonadetes bacterium]|nr:hypothetical protein [Armatimonadota bacterium]